jgi:hypothetical protein
MGTPRRSGIEICALVRSVRKKHSRLPAQMRSVSRRNKRNLQGNSCSQGWVRWPHSAAPLCVRTELTSLSLVLWCSQVSKKRPLGFQRTSPLGLVVRLTRLSTTPQLGYRRAHRKAVGRKSRTDSLTESAETKNTPQWQKNSSHL